MKRRSAEIESQRMNYAAGTDVTPRSIPELIRERAYELFEARGHEPGHELEDWLQAEQEVKHHLGTST